MITIQIVKHAGISKPNNQIYVEFIMPDDYASESPLLAQSRHSGAFDHIRGAL